MGLPNARLLLLSCAPAVLGALALAGCPSDGGPGDGGAADGGAPDGGGAVDAGPAYHGRTRYLPDEWVSPLNRSVAEGLREIRTAGPDLSDLSFMKVGASGTVSRSFLHCLAAGPTEVELDGRDDLQATIDFFASGDAAGTTPFERESLAAETGRTAEWAVSGAPAPLDQELSALRPRFALVNYGTNDMNMGTTHATALIPFYENLSTLLTRLSGRGVIPVVTSLNPRADDAEAARWVPTYDAVTRGLAESRQLPFLDLYEAVRDLPDQGLVADGIHGNVYTPDGAARACDFGAAGLAYNYNRRNLLTLEWLHRLRRVVVEGAEAADSGRPPVAGVGTADDPFVVDALPFTHSADTTSSPSDVIDAYPACDTGQDESGPEHFYRLELSEATPLRMAVLDLSGVDIDLHLLGATADAASCLARNDRILETTLEAGVWHLSLDTFVASGNPRPGAYLLVVVRCAPDDAACAP